MKLAAYSLRPMPVLTPVLLIVEGHHLDVFAVFCSGPEHVFHVQSQKGGDVVRLRQERRPSHALQQGFHAVRRGYFRVHPYAKDVDASGVSEKTTKEILLTV